jgi:hypothetical protein
LLEARRRRALGDYSRETLGLYERSWQLARTPETLLHFCLFRHELGYRLPDAWSRELAAAVPRLRPKDRYKADALRCRRQRTLDVSTQKKFAEWLCSSSHANVAVVGNSALLVNSGLARRIESAGCIVRFNHWQAANIDVGRRTDLWVRSPLDMQAHSSPPPTPPPSWIAVSGPEMIARRPEWPKWSAQSASPLISIPLRAWRALVRELKAPPSAGLLTLAWLRSIRGCWDGMVAYGIGYSGGPYHAAKPTHRPSHRHRWEKELTILERWTSEGLELRKN